ncbi:MAG: hypothetical protein ACOYJJ_05925 [Anaerovoracaceae bacterium]|jgi:hypothetical protein
MKKKLFAVVICLSLAFCFTACGSSGSSDSGSSSSSDSEEVKTVEEQNAELPAGKYVIGEDFEEGGYYFTYKTKLSKDDYWGTDYLWILNDGSKGSQETLGGTKYDDRYGGFEYQDAKKGKKVYVKLKDGDTLTVDSEEGTWTY